ncbi:hypothetical protein [Kosakonia radicincitans]|jgi:hypothetical protein|uniref:hypothetical protein n=1 Tax=Kosakonia radicincitans TaxID=283686 RepID=UPI0005C2BF55|nr:hypothetical protein [Kosakonia radicincitans]KIS43718.1 hypothetical protein LG58_4561 [Kosakonia radicincitans YD4]
MNSSVTKISIESALTPPTLHEPLPVFGFEEMLTELEAIVAEAEIRLAEEEAA